MNYNERLMPCPFCGGETVRKDGERSTARSAVICVGRDRKTKLLFSTTDWMELHAHGAL